MNLYDGWATVAATFFLLVNTPFFLFFSFLSFLYHLGWQVYFAGFGRFGRSASL
jgi:hypothetical protein